MQHSTILDVSQAENIQPHNPIKPYFYPRFVFKREADETPGMSLQREVVFAFYQLVLGKDPYESPESFVGVTAARQCEEIKRAFFHIVHEVERVLGPDAMDQDRCDDVGAFFRRRQPSKYPCDPDLYLWEAEIIDDDEYERRCLERERMMEDPASYLPFFLEDGFTKKELMDMFHKLQFETTTSKEVIEKLYQAAVAAYKGRK